MSKGFHDKRQELAHETQIKQALNRIKRGFKAIFGSWRKLLLLALCEAAAALLGLFMYPSAGSFLAPLTGLLVLLLTLLLLLACPIALAWAWGGPWQAGAIADDMTRAGMVNSAGEPPALESIKRDKKNTNIKVLLFDTCGLPPEEWLKNLAKMQSVLNGTILRISYGGDNRHVMVHLGPPQTELPTNITMRAFLQPVEPTKLVLGMGVLGEVTIDIKDFGHILLAGNTGSGKTVLLKSLLWQCHTKGMHVIIADFKGGVDFNNRWRERCKMCYDAEELEVILKDELAELDRRKALFREADACNIDEYNAKTGESLRRIVLGCDEAAELFDRTGLSKEQKAVVDRIERYISVIARQGRAFGLHLFLATQRPDASVIPGQIRSNLAVRICGLCDRILSELVFGSSIAATMVTPVPGRFLLNQSEYSNGTEESAYTLFQAYYFDDNMEV